MKRRKFAKNIALGVMAIQALPSLATNLKSSISRIPIGLCNHSLRSMRLDAQQLIQYAIDQKLDSVLLNTFQPFKSLDKKYLSDLRKLANSNGVSIYTGVGSISKYSTKFSDKYGSAEELLTEGLRVAKAVGSPVVGVRIGMIDDRFTEGGIEVHMEEVIRVMKLLRSQVSDAGVKLAFENHAGDLRIKELLTIINETGTDICGALFDPANAVWAMEDPMKALQNLGANIICTSVRDVQVWETKEGAISQGMAIGDGMLDFKRYSKTMAELCPGVPLHIETISNSAQQIPFQNPDFWKGFSGLSMDNIADFIRFIKRGTPQLIIKPPTGNNKREFDIELQQTELLKSFKYLRAICNIGLKF
ncbi:TIM barrel protein [uncultured Draconibacterium sp.]|uniref:sugar phosphate isomerase/epimerase family protein n=1 Tax=uncultured Draconibacterium sp. TaxID=1573823 RepID=UPI0029C7E899|nr:TIM barrel protein [uncultured Draconibacterium sp.]